MKQILKMENLTGRTIAKASSLDESLLLAFNDGTFAIIQTVWQSGSCGDDYHTAEVDDTEYDTSYKLIADFGFEAVRVGLVREHEYSDIVKEQDRKEKKRKSNEKAAKKRNLKQRELSELKRLTKKYKSD